MLTGSFNLMTVEYAEEELDNRQSTTLAKITDDIYRKILNLQLETFLFLNELDTILSEFN